MPYKETYEEDEGDQEFEDVIEQINGIDFDIDLVDSYKNMKDKKYKKLVKHIDKNDEDQIFDSAHIIWVPFIQIQVKRFINRLREKRLARITGEGTSMSVSEELPQKNTTSKINGSITEEKKEHL